MFYLKKPVFYRAVLFAVILLLAAGCNSKTSVTSKSIHNDPDKLMAELADAFQNKDIASVSQFISDPHNTLKLTQSWSDESWQSIANAFRDAKLKSDSIPNERTYEVIATGSPIVQLNNESKDIKLIVNKDNYWALDFQSIIATPTEF